MSKSLSPIVVFAYRRPEHLRRTLSSLTACEGFDVSPVIVYCDGPKNAGERAATERTRQVARKLLGGRAEYHCSPANLGLARSVIRGVTEVVERFGRAIVLEDDLVLSPGFLTYMNAALDRYADEANVVQVSGYMFDVPELIRQRKAFFLPFTVSWGWATWKRAWDLFDPLATGWEVLQRDKDLRCRFNLHGAYDYAGMLENQMAGRIDSWAIRWYWSVFRANGLVLFPSVTLVQNIGMDGSGTHGRGVLRKLRQRASVVSPTVELGFPETVAVAPAELQHVSVAIRGGKMRHLINTALSLGKKKSILCP